MRISTLSTAARRRPGALCSLAAVAALSLPLAACGGSSNGGSSGAGGSSPSGGTKQDSQTNKSAAKAGGATGVATTKVPGYGTALATASGSPLYLLTADPNGGSSCSGSCAKQWPPFTVSGSPTAGSGVNASLLSSFKRSDGTTQVLYGGHALYTHPGLSAASVAGTASDGGIWYLVSPSGKPIKSTSGSGY